MERPKAGETYKTLDPDEAREVALYALYETAVNWLDLTRQARTYFRQKPEELHTELDQLVAKGKVAAKLAERMKLEFPLLSQ